MDSETHTLYAFHWQLVLGYRYGWEFVWPGQ